MGHWTFNPVGFICASTASRKATTNFGGVFALQEIFAGTLYELPGGDRAPFVLHAFRTKMRMHGIRSNLQGGILGTDDAVS